MDHLSRLIEKALEMNSRFDAYRDNPYMGKSFHELICMLHIDADPGVPEDGTPEKDKFNVALLEACRNRKKLHDILIQCSGRGLTESVEEPEKDPLQEPEKKDSIDFMEAYKKLYEGGSYGRKETQDQIENSNAAADQTDHNQGDEHGNQW